ncbi:hypothetical protein B6N60_03422 [Richelia sinica FACHB-800]|uniref:Uncharacterized protein n=1 Tax=Richelia sinica FACHB-800 TaxID=1357546 RepID=A0A975T9W9_9NOST|nr:tubulin-like doman-containing protein [Richelia sinica]MBD2663526.1 hypothetical protein [Richelia sinica FACHB-800]QXE24714.1 hypothetical protein B6N60_03422 [Richelia sinica FACHB-800]
MSIYVIGIGGTGAKCIEAIIQLASIGLFNEETLNLLFVDADENNGNLERARKSLKIYQDCHELNLADKFPWMKTEIRDFGLWSPFANTSVNKNLGSFFEYNLLKDDEPALGNLFDVLYTSQEREANLDVGFRGRPAIGAAVMSQVKLDALDYDSWCQLLNQLQTDTGSGKRPKVFLCGSIFGGTGASGLPTIGRLIHNKLENLRIRSKVDIGCLFALPYFGFNPTLVDSSETVYARSDQFLLNTEAALRYYGIQSQETFDTVYLLGNQNLSPVKVFSVGKNTQRNDPHFIEMYAALAARQFLLNTNPQQKTVVLMNRESLKNITWRDIPEHKLVRDELVNATRFAFVWLADIAPLLAEGKRAGVREIQRSPQAFWFVKFFPDRAVLGNNQQKLVDFNDPEQQNAIETISIWCQDYLRWLSQIHQCVDENIQLFNAKHFANGSMKPDNLSDLIIGGGDSRDKNQKSRDTVQELKRRLNPAAISNLPKIGIFGLAKALYIVCRL